MKMSLTDANAVLGRGRMHVLSADHVSQLLPEMNGGWLSSISVHTFYIVVWGNDYYHTPYFPMLRGGPLGCRGG